MSTAKASAAEALWRRTLDCVAQRFGLAETPGATGEAWLPLHCHAPVHQGRIGQVRRFQGAPLFQLVSTNIGVPPIGLDSHMLFAFTPSDSPVPHFTLDAVQAGDHYAFHLDLIPRVDLGANLAYMDACFTPLTAAFAKGQAAPGLSPAQLSPRQHAVMSPWMLAKRATQEAFLAIDELVESYLNHWLSLVEQGVPEAARQGISATTLADRDRRNKAIIFNRDVDKVWDQITPLVGEDAAERQIELLRRTSVSA